MPTTLDQMAVGLLGLLYQKHVAPKVPQGFDLWSNGLGRLAQGAVQAAGVPQLTGDEVAAGVLAMLGVGQPRLRVGAPPRMVRRVSIDKNGQLQFEEVQPQVIDVKAERV